MKQSNEDGKRVDRIMSFLRGKSNGKKGSDAGEGMIEGTESMSGSDKQESGGMIEGGSGFSGEASGSKYMNSAKPEKASMTTPHEVVQDESGLHPDDDGDLGRTPTGLGMDGADHDEQETQASHDNEGIDGESASHDYNPPHQEEEDMGPSVFKKRSKIMKEKSHLYRRG